ncbi:MAG TPA: hypothetical protein VF251_15750, partial [Pyrinomonadaceae bacterium]
CLVGQNDFQKAARDRMPRFQWLLLCRNANTHAMVWQHPRSETFRVYSNGQHHVRQALEIC